MHTYARRSQRCSPGPDNINWVTYSVPLCLLLFVGGTYLRVRQTWKNHPTIAQKATYVLSDAGLSIEGESYNQSLAWSDFSAMNLLDRAVIIFFGKDQVCIIPNDSFVDSNQREQVARFIGSHIPAGNRRRLRSPVLTILLLAMLAFTILVIVVYLYVILFQK